MLNVKLENANRFSEKIGRLERTNDDWKNNHKDQASQGNESTFWTPSLCPVRNFVGFCNICRDGGFSHFPLGDFLNINF